MRSLSRRRVLRGIGATVALPFLDAMIPARAVAATRRKVRLVCVEMVHGAAGSAPIGIKRNLWAPAAVGRDFDLTPTSLRSLEPFREHLTIVVSLIPYFLEKLRQIPDEDGATILDNTLLLYGSAMGDSNQHSHKRVPFVIAGRAGGALDGGVHLRAQNGTPLANVMLSVLRALD